MCSLFIHVLSVSHVASSGVRVLYGRPLRPRHQLSQGQAVFLRVAKRTDECEGDAHSPTVGMEPSMSQARVRPLPCGHLLHWDRRSCQANIQLSPASPLSFLRSDRGRQRDGSRSILKNWCSVFLIKSRNESVWILIKEGN